MARVCLWKPSIPTTSRDCRRQLSGRYHNGSVQTECLTGLIMCFVTFCNDIIIFQLVCMYCENEALSTGFDEFSGNGLPYSIWHLMSNVSHHCCSLTAIQHSIYCFSINLFYSYRLLMIIFTIEQFMHLSPCAYCYGTEGLHEVYILIYLGLQQLIISMQSPCIPFSGSHASTLTVTYALVLQLSCIDSFS